jgi:hypothetical protein
VKVKTPKEDPRIKSARESEERRADAAFIENTGQLLDEETRKRIRRFGNRGSAMRAVASGGGAASGGSGGGSYDPGSVGGSSMGGGRGSSAGDLSVSV